MRFKCGDSDDLAKCLMQLLNDPTRLGKLREEAVQEVQRKFSVAASAAVLEEGFKEYALIRKEKTLF